MKVNIDQIHDKCIDFEKNEIYLHRSSLSGENDDDVDINLSSTFIKNFNILSRKKNAIIIHMNGISGGNWQDFLSIYDTIITSEAYVSIIIYGHACSAGSIIAQAADYRVAMPNSYMMCHFGSEGINDSYLNFHSYSKFSTKCTKLMIDIYTNCLVNSEFVKEKKHKNPISYSKKFINNKLRNGDWYLTSEDMVYYGFVDAVMGSELCKTIDNLR